MSGPLKLVIKKPFEWTLIIRRLDLPTRHRKVKLVAYTLATYADFEDGRNVRPGVKRLMRDTGYGERWIRESLTLLRDNYLIYRNQRGSSTGKANLVDVYQLCAPEDWETRFQLTSEIEADEFADPWAPQ